MVIPETYAQWRHCITVGCDIALTSAFVVGAWPFCEIELTLILTADVITFRDLC